MFRDLKAAVAAVCAASAMMAAAGTASAAIVSITYAGTAAVGNDYGGLFGSAGASLVGQSVSETFTFNTNLGQPLTGSTWAETSYDPVLTPGYTQPLVSVSVSVDGNEIYLPVDATIRSIYNEGAVSSFQRVYTGYYYNDGSTATELGTSFWDQGVPIDLSQPYFSDSPGAGAPGSGGSFDSIIINDNYAASGTTETWMQFVPSSVLISVAVPEPATWAMMLVGIFGMGAALRRRRSACGTVRAV